MNKNTEETPKLGIWIYYTDGESKMVRFGTVERLIEFLTCESVVGNTNIVKITRF